MTASFPPNWKTSNVLHRWRRGELDPHELNDQIHAFHQGASRKLFSRYTDSEPTWAVAGAIARGILADSDVPDGVREFLTPALSFARDQLTAESEADEPDSSD